MALYAFDGTKDDDRETGSSWEAVAADTNIYRFYSAYTGNCQALDVNTEYQITKLTAERGGRQTSGKLNLGRTWHRVAAVAETGAYEVTGANTTAAAQGTAFVVYCVSANVCKSSIGSNLRARTRSKKLSSRS